MTALDWFRWATAFLNVVVALIALRLLATEKNWHPIQRVRADRLRRKMRGD